MNNRVYIRLAISLFDDTRLSVLGSQFGENEALGIYVRLLKIMYKDYPDGIPWLDPVVASVAKQCCTDEATMRSFAEMCCSPMVDWFAMMPLSDAHGEVIGERLMSRGAVKNIEWEAKQSDAGKMARGVPKTRDKG